MSNTTHLFLATSLILIVGFSTWFLFGRQSGITNAPPTNDTIVAFGDSLVEGVGSSGGGFVSLLEKKLGRPIINRGVSGNTTADGLLRIESVLKDDPGIVILVLGGNDALRSVPKEETFRNLERIVTALQSSGAVVVLVGVRGALLSDPYDEAYRELAERTGALYVENILKGLLTRPEYMSDAVHPNDRGYAIIADRLNDELSVLFR